MDRRHWSMITVAVAGCLAAGCTLPNRPVPGVHRSQSQANSQEVARASASQPDDSPLRRFEALLTGEGISTKPARLGQAAKLVVAWNNKVVYAPNTTSGGEPMPALVARMWLFGPDEKIPIEPDGELFIAAWDCSPRPGGSKPVLIEGWHIDRDNANKYRKPDAWGSGYSLLLPWSSYHVDLKQVVLQARYNGTDGRSLISTPQTINVDHSETLERARARLAASNPEALKAQDIAPLPPRDWPTK